VFAVPATAGVAMAIALAFGGSTVDPASGTSGNPGAVASVTDSVADSDSLTALVVAEVDAVDEEFALDNVDDATLLAFADLDQAPAFAFADLDGSTDQDLDAVEAALDRAIRNL
jgi:hypothetical protein